MPSKKRWRKVMKKQVLFVLIALVAGFLIFNTYLEAVSGSASLAGKFITNEKGETPLLTLEIANTPELRRKGLMFRKELPSDRGMIFIYRHEGDNSFWMKNTFIPLDLVFLSADLKVIGVIPELEPLSEVSRKIGKPSKYVIELPGKRALELGIREGDKFVPSSKIPEAS